MFQMLNVFIFTLLMTCTLALNKNNEINDLNLQYRDNVIFQEITTISTSHSQWLFSFLIDIQPFDIVLSKSLKNIKRIQNILNQVIQKYSKHKDYLYGILNKLNIPGKLFEKCKKACMSKSTKNDELSREEISDQKTSKLSNTRTWPGLYPQLDSMDVSDPPRVIPTAAGTPCIVPSKSCTTSNIHKANRAWILCIRLLDSRKSYAAVITLYISCVTLLFYIIRIYRTNLFNLVV